MLPSIASLQKICNAFDMSMAQFFSEGNLKELDNDQTELLEQWSLLTPEQKRAISNKNSLEKSAISTNYFFYT